MSDTKENTMTGADLIAAERQRQIDVEGWTPEHDAEHDRGELADAAHRYLSTYCEVPSDADWPWEPGAWKPSSNPVQNLVRAGALIAAEIDRLQRGNDR